MEENKEKLIKLFKQCCDNNDFEKTKEKTYLKDFIKIDLNNDSNPFVLDSELSDFLKDELGYKIEKINFSANNRNGRIFYFDKQPPLILIDIDVRIDLRLKKRIF